MLRKPLVGKKFAALIALVFAAPFRYSCRDRARSLKASYTFSELVVVLDPFGGINGAFV
jgi:hypothetical protein